MRIILTLQVGLDEHDTRLVNMSVTPTQVGFPENMVVENEDRIVEVDFVMEEVETEPETTPPTTVRQVFVVKGY